MTDSAVAGEQGQQLLVTVHNHLRDELEQLRQVIRDVRRGADEPAEARSYLNQMAMRQNYWTLGAFCAAYCRVLSMHHAIEDQRMFPDACASRGYWFDRWVWFGLRPPLLTALAGGRVSRLLLCRPGRLSKRSLPSWCAPR